MVVTVVVVVPFIPNVVAVVVASVVAVNGAAFIVVVVVASIAMKIIGVRVIYSNYTSSNNSKYIGITNNSTDNR